MINKPTSLPLPSPEGLCHPQRRRYLAADVVNVRTVDKARSHEVNMLFLHHPLLASFQHCID